MSGARCSICRTRSRVCAPIASVPGNSISRRTRRSSGSQASSSRIARIRRRTCASPCVASARARRSACAACAFCATACRSRTPMAKRRSTISISRRSAASRSFAAPRPRSTATRRAASSTFAAPMRQRDPFAAQLRSQGGSYETSRFTGVIGGTFKDGTYDANVGPHLDERLSRILGAAPHERLRAHDVHLGRHGLRAAGDGDR